MICKAAQKSKDIKSDRKDFGGGHQMHQIYMSKHKSSFIFSQLTDKLDVEIATTLEH